jgi:NAD(P) transhydrogenase subunit beta
MSPATVLVPTLIDIAYLVAATLFIFGIKRLASPATTRSGNLLGAAGMLLAVLVTLLDREIIGFTAILAGILVGGAIGVVMARRVKMTAMPQMVAVLNGFGGGASALIAVDEYLRFARGATDPALDVRITIVLSVLIGAVTLTGSLIAFAKLQELMAGRPVTYPLQKTGNALLFLAIAALGVLLVAGAPDTTSFTILAAGALLLGVLLVIPIGGADMPVVISLLNSYSGIAAAAAGFVLYNYVLIVAGALVGASGIILTRIMCKAMNRSLGNVIFGAFGAAPETAGPAAATGGSIQEITAEDTAILLSYARSVVIIPGYGLAVAQAQHQVRDLAKELEARGITVKYAVHPVAGRMPGHLNVILSDAGVEYDALIDMDEANLLLPRTEVAIVIGANDVVNPAARESPESPLYGMPIINADAAQTVIVVKRSMNPGVAGVDNPLFYKDQSRMLFGDAKGVAVSLLGELKAVRV